MIRHKIVHRLISTYTILLGIFTLIMLTLFFSLFNKQGVALHQEQMKEQGDVIAETIVSEGYLTRDKEDNSMHGRMMGNKHMSGTNRFLSLISQLSTDEIYIVTPDGEALFSSHMLSENQSRNHLPLLASEVMKSVQVNSDDRFIDLSDYGESYTLGYVVPLKNDQDELLGNVIVLSKKAHSFTKSLSDYRLLILSVVSALIVTIIISIIIAKRFVKPIYEMEAFTDSLIETNYGYSIEIETKDELAKLGGKLSILSQRLLAAQKDQLNKDKHQKLFLSQISHELRTPVMVIKNSLATLEINQLNEEEKRDYLASLIQETNQLSRLVNDLLELTRLESTEFSINKEPISLPDVCQDSIRSFREVLKTKNQEIVFTNKLYEADIFVGDYQRMSQLIKILLDNSLKYSPQNSDILLVLDKNEKNILIDVENKVEDIRHVPSETEAFKAFTRGRMAREEGHGLGLTIAEEITKRHGGTIKMSLSTSERVKISLVFKR